MFIVIHTVGILEHRVLFAAVLPNTTYHSHGEGTHNTNPKNNSNNNAELQIKVRVCGANGHVRLLKTVVTKNCRTTIHQEFSFFSNEGELRSKSITISWWSVWGNISTQIAFTGTKGSPFVLLLGILHNLEI